MKGNQRYILPIYLKVLFRLVRWMGSGRIHAEAVDLRKIL